MTKSSSWRAKIRNINVALIATIACPAVLAITASGHSQITSLSENKNASRVFNDMSDAFKQYIQVSQSLPMHYSMEGISNVSSSNKVALSIFQYHRLKAVTLALDTCDPAITETVGVTPDYPDKALPPDVYMNKLNELKALCFGLEPSA